MGSGSSLLSCGVFLPPPLLQAFPLLVAGCTPHLCHRFSGPSGLFIYSPGKDFLPPIFSAQGTPASFLCVFIVLIAYYSVSLFFQVDVGLSRELCCSGPGFVCGSTTVPWSSPGPLLPKPSWCWPLAARGPSLFLCLMWGGDSLLHLEVWRGQSYAFPQWLCLQNVSPASLQDFTIGGSLSASSLYLPSWNPIHHVCFIPSSYDGTWVDYRSQILWKLPQWALLGRCFIVMWIHFIVSCVIIQGVTLLGCFFFPCRWWIKGT
jgi:hypothetical protein